MVRPTRELVNSLYNVPSSQILCGVIPIHFPVVSIPKAETVIATSLATKSQILYSHELASLASAQIGWQTKCYHCALKLVACSVSDSEVWFLDSSGDGRFARSE